MTVGISWYCCFYSMGNKLVVGLEQVISPSFNLFTLFGTLFRILSISVSALLQYSMIPHKWFMKTFIVTRSIQIMKEYQRNVCRLQSWHIPSSSIQTLPWNASFRFSGSFRCLLVIGFPQWIYCGEAVESFKRNIMSVLFNNL